MPEKFNQPKQEQEEDFTQGLDYPTESEAGFDGLVSGLNPDHKSEFDDNLDKKIKDGYGNSYSKRDVFERIIQYHSDVDINSSIVRELSSVGEKDLAMRYAKAILKKSIDEMVSEGILENWSHNFLKSYWQMFYANPDDELTKKLGEVIVILLENQGSFHRAYEYYRYACPEKYAEKLGTVKLDEGEEEWPARVPDDSRKDNFPDLFPDFHMIKDQDERDIKTNELIELFLSTLPEEITNMDTKVELEDIKKQAEVRSK